MAFGPHPVDKVLFKVSLGSIAILTLMSFYSTLTFKDLVCWCPAHFTGIMEAYAQRTCASNSSAKVNLDESYKHRINSDHPVHKAVFYPLNTQGVYYNLAIEAVISCVSYLVLCHVASTAAIGASGLHPLNAKVVPTYNGIAISYFVAEILVSTGWLCLYLFHPEPPEARDPFLCDFKVTMRGRDILPYTIQCQPGVDTMLPYIFSMNKILCIAMSMLVIVHVINMFIVVPLLKRLMKAGVAKLNQTDAADYGCCYGCSDQFIMSVLNTGNRPYLGAHVGPSKNIEQA